MKVYAAIKYDYNDDDTQANEKSYIGFYATKDIARKYIEKFVSEIKRERAYSDQYYKFLKDNYGKPREKIQPKLDKMREMFYNGCSFEYIPEENERDVWVDDRYFPFICLDDDGLDYLVYKIDKYGDCYCDYAGYYQIQEIEIIDA